MRQFCISSPDDFPATFCPLSNNPAVLLAKIPLVPRHWRKTATNKITRYDTVGKAVV
ncbi:MAG: hypothetical protein WCF03_17330 [Nitrososphaeraceae archaeon]